MNFCKVTKAQCEYVKLTWSSDIGELWVRNNSAGAKKRSANGKEINMLVALDMVKVLKMNNISKYKGTYNSDSED